MLLTDNTIQVSVVDSEMVWSKTINCGNIYQDKNKLELCIENALDDLADAWELEYVRYDEGE